MTEITILGNAYPIAFNNYVFHQFSKAIGEDSPGGADKRLMSMNGKDGGITNEGQKVFFSLVHEMLKHGAELAGNELKLTYANCFELSKEGEMKVVQEYQNAQPKLETIKKESGKKAKAA